MKVLGLKTMQIYMLVLLLLSCSNRTNYLNRSLKLAGENRTELEQVLVHYSDNPEKLAAARFLIENMPAHYSYADSSAIHEYYSIALNVLQSDLSPVAQRDSLYNLTNSRFYGLEYNTISDVKIIKSDFLIKSIDQAFKEWKERPWAAHLTFDEFCEWLLPYKAVELQEHDHWRDTLSTYFTWGLNNMVHDDDTYETTYNAAGTIRNEMNWRLKPYGVYTVKGHSMLSSSTLIRQTYGSCMDYVTTAVLTYRSVGIPSVIDETPYWGRYRAGHCWYTVLNNRGEELTSEWDISSMLGGSFFIDKRIPKVYRHTYAINREREEYLKKSAFKFPFDVCRRDITDSYFNTSDIEIPMLKGIRLKEKYCYIATFTGLNEDWSIVDFGIVKRGKACFKKMGRNVMYIALGFDGINLIPISTPFILHTNGSIEYITPQTAELRSVEVRRKYYQSNNVAKMRKRIQGGIIQGSSTPDFKQTDTLYTISSTNIPDKIQIETTKPYRYVRYLSPAGSYGSIAELAFFDADTVRINGTAIGNSTDKANLQRAFDDDWLSNYETGNADGNWVGMDFGTPVKINYVRIVPRSDDNDIHPGDVYELKYWSENNRWVSRGLQTATDNRLYYDSIPSGALMWVSNYTRGWDERPFLIDEDGSVEWW